MTSSLSPNCPTGTFILSNLTVFNNLRVAAVLALSQQQLCLFVGMMRAVLVVVQLASFLHLLAVNDSGETIRLRISRSLGSIESLYSKCTWSGCVPQQEFFQSENDD